MTIPTELPQETRHFRVNPYISFRGKRGSNILGHHSKMMKKEVKTVFDRTKYLKLRSKTLKMRCFSCRFELFSYLCNRFTTHLVLFGYYKNYWK